MERPRFLPQVRLAAGGAMGGPSMGLPMHDLYVRAKGAAAAFAWLAQRATSLPNEAARADALAWIGDPATDGSPAFRAATVAIDLAAADATAPPNYGVYTDARRAARVAHLEGIDRELEARLEAVGG